MIIWKAKRVLSCHLKCRVFSYYSVPCIFLKILGEKLNVEVIVENPVLMKTNGSDQGFNINPAS